jgi:hypothetical protein
MSEVSVTVSKSRQAGVSMIEVMVASLLLVIASLSILTLISISIVTNNRNRMDSTGTMLAQTVVQQIKATLIGSGVASLTDCDGTAWSIDSSPGGSLLSGDTIDFSETSPPTNYHMNFVMKSPCTPTGDPLEAYDVRWHVEIVGDSAGTPTRTYAIYLGARKQNHGEGNMFYSLPVNFRVMVGN